MEFDDALQDAAAKGLREQEQEQEQEQEEVVGGAPEYRVRARFYAIRQADGEPVYDWYRRVRAAAVPCRFRGADRLAPVADRFVTGLRPGPVADRLLGVRADGPLEDLLSVAVAVERAEELTVRRRRRCAAGDDDDASVVGRSPTDTADRTTTTGANDGARDSALIREIREGLKLYRYSSEGYAATRRGESGSGDDASNGYSHKSPPENVFIGNMKSKLGEKSWWKNKIERNSKQLKNNITSLKSEKYIDQSYGSSHHDSKCYCSWITNDGCQEKNLTTSKAKKSNYPISKCLDNTKKIECCVCNV